MQMVELPPSQTTPAFSAFETQLRTLCLREFPCGVGTWRETKPKQLQKIKQKENIENRFPVTLKDFGAKHEKTETLEEYVSSKSSPWKLDYSWSSEAKQLREIAVKSPWLVDDKFVLQHFKTLRLTDKNISEVDEDLLKFTNLEELSLSCNFVSSLNSKNLPPSLKVLELCANQISDLSALCIRPPDLIHLGLGYNKITYMGDYLMGDNWPHLLSLDLSHNNLTDLLDVIRKLGTLPKLRNLILQGNPLSLIPGYRGYTIDSLRKLTILDDIMISADEKHHFKGLARRREFILDEAKLTFEVSYIKGVPMPDEIKNPDDQPEFPVIERKYFVQFMFLEDTSAKADVLQLDQGDMAELGTILSTARSEEGEIALQETGRKSTESEEALPDAVKNVIFTEEPDVVIAREATAEPGRQTEQTATQATPSAEQDGEKLALKLEPVKSAGDVWAEEIELNWSKMVIRDDLMALRDFLKQGMDFSVVEEMVLCYPVIPEEGEEGAAKVLMFPSEDDRSVTPSGKKGKGDKKGEKKDDKGKPKGNEKDDKGKKKKKGEPEHELKRNPPTFTTLATWHINLEDFLEGEATFRSIFTQGNVEVASTIKTVDSDARRDGKKDKKKPHSAAKKGKDDKGKDRKMSAANAKAGDKKGDKGKGGKGPPAPADDDAEDNSPPPPLEVEVAVNLHHWKTAMDLLKEQEEKKKNEEQAAQES